MTTPKLERGRALVLYGPQGCGKTQLARALAAATGRYAEIDSDRLAADLPDALRGRPATIIVDGGFPRADITQLKAWITNETICLRTPYSMQSEQVRAPNFIFCTNEARERDAFAAGGRRFHVVTMQGRRNG